MRKIAKTLLVILGVVVVAWPAETALTVWEWRRRSRWALRLIKRFNKYVLNPVMLRFAGRSGPSATPAIAH